VGNILWAATGAALASFRFKVSIHSFAMAAQQEKK